MQLVLKFKLQMAKKPSQRHQNREQDQTKQQNLAALESQQEFCAVQRRMRPMTKPLRLMRAKTKLRNLYDHLRDVVKAPHGKVAQQK